MMKTKIRHPEKVNKPVNPIKKKPDWIRSKLSNSKEFFLTKTIVNQNNLVTVCQEANCPNITECWSKRHATFMIMGDTCTRACAFCDVKTGKPEKLDPFEPYKISNAVSKLDLKHVVITSVDRDDLDDGGSNHFYEVINATRKKNPKTSIEVLTPDFLRKGEAYKKIFDADLDESEDYNSTSHLTSGSSVMQVAVVGRPNAGKSTLVNKILGEDRLLTGPEAGITRDAISISTTWNGTKFRIFDTAGMRKRAKVNEKIEKLSVSDGLRAVNFSEVVVILLDVENPFEVQDLRIADLAEREGRAVVVAINKWDLEKQKQKQTKVLLEKFYRLLPQLKGAPLISVSAKTGAGLNRLYDAIIKAYTVWNIRVPTARLNRWLDEIVSAHPPPAPGGRRIRLRYMTQAKTRPPTFVIFCSRANELPASYSRYLVNGLRIYFDLPGTPIRLIIKSGENPYAEKAKKRKLG